MSELLSNDLDLTPGPWIARTAFRKSFDDHGFRKVCEVSRDGETLVIYAEAQHMWRDGEGNHWGKDDAKLIAAAPALHEALRVLYDETADYIRLNHLGDVHHNRSMQLARDALAALENVNVTR